MNRLLKNHAGLVAILAMICLVLNYGCGGGGGSMTSVNQSVDTNQQNTTQVPVTQTQQEFIDAAKAEYAKSPESPEANFKMAVAESILNTSGNAELDSLSNNAQGLAPSIVGLLKIFTSQQNYSPSVNLVSGINFSAAALKLNAASTVTVGSVQDVIVSTIIPVINRELVFLRKAEVPEFKYETTYAYLKRMASNPTITLADNDAVVLDQTDILVIDGFLSIAKGFLHFACVFNFDAQSSQANYNDVTEVLKIREYSNASGKGITNLKAARENVALGFDNIVQALTLRAQNNEPQPRRKLIWADRAACELASKELSYIRDALRAGTAYDLKFPEIVSNAAAFVRINFSAWESNPTAVDLKQFIKAVMAADPKSSDAASYDFTLGGLFPEFTSKAAIQAKIDSVKAINSINVISFLQKFVVVDNPAFVNADLVDVARLVSQIETSYRTRNATLFASLFDATQQVAIDQAAAYKLSGLPNGAENMEIRDYLFDGSNLAIIADKHNHPMVFNLSKIYNPTSGKMEFRILKVLDNFDNNDANFAGITIAPAANTNLMVNTANFEDGALKPGFSEVFASGVQVTMDPGKVTLTSMLNGASLILGSAIAINADKTFTKVGISDPLYWLAPLRVYQLLEPAPKCNFLICSIIGGNGVVTKRQVSGLTYYKPTKEYTLPTDKVTLGFTVPTLPTYEYKYMYVRVTIEEANAMSFVDFVSDISNINSNLKVVIGRALSAGSKISVKMVPAISNRYYSENYRYKLTGSLDYSSGASATVAMTLIDNFNARAMAVLTSGTGKWESQNVNDKRMFFFKTDGTYEFYPDKTATNVKELGTFGIDFSSEFNGTIWGTVTTPSGSQIIGFQNQQLFQNALDSLLAPEPLVRLDYSNYNFKKVLQ